MCRYKKEAGTTPSSGSEAKLSQEFSSRSTKQRGINNKSITISPFHSLFVYFIVNPEGCFWFLTNERTDQKTGK